MPSSPRSAPRVALARPVTTVMAFVAAVVVGAVAWHRIPLDFIPEVSRPQLSAWVPYPNATPQEVERQVLEPLQEDLRTIAGLRSIRGYAQRDAANVRLEFEQGTNMRVAYLEVRDRFETLRRTMPPEARRYYLWRMNEADMPIMFMTLSWPGSVHELSRIAETRVKPALERIPGVAMIDIQGTSSPQVQILLDQHRMQQHGIDPYQLIQRLRRYDVSMSAGAVREGARRMIVRAVDTYETPEQVANIQISPKGLRLRDIADVYYGYPDREFVGRVDGANATSMAIRKVSLANSVATCDAVLATLDALCAAPDLTGLAYSIIFNQGAEIRKAVVGLRTAGIWGGAFAIVMLLVFLRRWRMTMLIAVAIPLSLSMAVAGLYLTGRTLNVITMLGLMLAVGALVDNSVVVVENIVRLRQEGHAPHAAAAHGAGQVGLAILAATATSIVVFVPLVFTRGEMRIYLRELGLSLGFSLLASLVVAMTLVPLAASRLLRGAAPVPTRFGRGMSRWYERVLRSAIAHPWVVAVLVVVLVGSTAAGPARRLTRGGRPATTMRQAEIEIKTGFPASNLERTEAFFSKFEDYLNARRDELEIRTIFSFSGRDNNRLRVFVAFREAPVSTTPVQQLIERLSDALPDWPDGEMTVRHFDEGSDRKTFTVRVRGESEDMVDRIVRQLARRFAALPGVQHVDDGSESDTPELQVRVDRERIARAGLNSQSVGTTLAFALRGTRLASLQTAHGEVEVWTQLEHADRADQMTLGDLRMASPTGRVVPLNTVARFRPAPSPRRLAHYNGRREREVRVTTEGMPLSASQQLLRAVSDRIVLPPGYEIVQGHRFDDFAETQQELRLAVLLGVVMIYLVMAALFESLLSPLLILTSVPLALFGALWVMHLTGTELDVATGVGLVLLIGVVANNGIVIVDRINQVRAEGLPLVEAVVEGGGQRLRPVLMTAFTTVLGIVPLAVGDASLLGGEIMFAPVGRAIMAGLISSTVLVLVLVPFGYVLLARLQAWCRAVWVAVREPANREPALRERHGLTQTYTDRRAGL